MKKAIYILFFAYISAIVLANYTVFWIGEWGLVITAIFLIPFDFVIRAVLHERWKAGALWSRLLGIISLGAVITYTINHETASIAIGSATAFISAGIAASLFYQTFLSHRFFLKVNGSDLVAIIVDSYIFQYITFNDISFQVMGSQVGMKAIGGFLWYWVFFERIKIQQYL